MNFELPTVFESRRLKFLFDTKSGATPASGTKEYWDGDINWVTPEDLGKLKDRYVRQTRRRISDAGYKNSGASLAAVDSLVLSKRAPIGQVAILSVDAACNQGCFLLSKQPGIDERFYYYSLLYLRPLLEILGCGSTFMELSADNLRSIQLPFPNAEIQALIADYLDRETAHIDALVAEKEKMLALLEEKRATLISRTVTRGLNFDVPMKPSGLDWLGDIPAHWGVRRLKFISVSLEQGSSPVAANTPAEPGELGVLKLSAVNKSRFKREENKSLRKSDGRVDDLSLRRGDVLITRGNTPELVADVACVLSDEPNLLLPDLIYRLRVCDDKLLPEFVTYFLTTRTARVQIQRDARGSSGSMVKVSQEHVLNWQVPLPPLVEQLAIVNQINTAEIKSETIHNQISTSLSLLKERRTALIIAAVTGQIPIKEMTT